MVTKFIYCLDGATAPKADGLDPTILVMLSIQLTSGPSKARIVLK
jgi:hypothetical protein